MNTPPADDHQAPQNEDTGLTTYMRPSARARDWIPPEILGRAAVGLARHDQVEAILNSEFGRRALRRMWTRYPPDISILRNTAEPDSPTALLLSEVFFRTVARASGAPVRRSEGDRRLHHEPLWPDQDDELPAGRQGS